MIFLCLTEEPSSCVNRDLDMESKSNRLMESQTLYDDYNTIGPKVISIILISQSTQQSAVGLIGTLLYIYIYIYIYTINIYYNYDPT
jgi:hypothetical protein